MHAQSDSTVPNEEDWRYIDDWDRLHHELDSVIRDALSDRKHLDVLEAGCGTRWPLKLRGHTLRIVGVDADADALEYRQNHEGDLDQSIHGDLTSVRLPDDSFDLVYCSYVLEHVDGAQAVLDNFLDWLRPGGLMVLKIPDRDSVFGFTTRITPFYLHVLYKRYVMGNPNAGKKGHDPFPTFYDKVVSKTGLTQFCDDNQLLPLAMYRTDFFPKHLVRTRLLVRLFSKVMQSLSFGKLAGGHSGLAVILQKPR